MGSPRVLLDFRRGQHYTGRKPIALDSFTADSRDFSDAGSLRATSRLVSSLLTNNPKKLDFQAAMGVANVTARSTWSASDSHEAIDSALRSARWIDDTDLSRISAHQHGANSHGAGLVAPASGTMQRGQGRRSGTCASGRRDLPPAGLPAPEQRLECVE